jgi:hypothetical protein
MADRKLAKTHGVAAFEDFGIGDGGVRHVRVQRMSAAVASPAPEPPAMVS